MSYLAENLPKSGVVTRHFERNGWHRFFLRSSATTPLLPEINASKCVRHVPEQVSWMYPTFTR